MHTKCSCTHKKENKTTTKIPTVLLPRWGPCFRDLLHFYLSTLTRMDTISRQTSNKTKPKENSPSHQCHNTLGPCQTCSKATAEQSFPSSMRAPELAGMPMELGACKVRPGAIPHLFPGTNSPSRRPEQEALVRPQVNWPNLLCFSSSPGARATQH